MTIARTAIWAFRIVVTLYAGLLISQPIWIGLFLEGQFEQLAVHRAVGGAAIAATWLVVLGAVALGWFARLSWWPTWLSVALFWMLTGQFVLGQSRLTALHIPFGVLIVGLAVALAVWSWLPTDRHLAGGRPRRRRTEQTGGLPAGAGRQPSRADAGDHARTVAERIDLAEATG